MTTIDQAIAALTAAKEKIGGHCPVWIAASNHPTKWHEESVVRIDAVDDGESCYARIQGLPEQADEHSHSAGTPDADQRSPQVGRVTNEMRTAVANALGRKPTDALIHNAAHTYQHLSISALKGVLRQKHREFTNAGGRGIKLADEIDELRVALTLKVLAKQKAEQ